MAWPTVKELEGVLSLLALAAFIGLLWLFFWAISYGPRKENRRRKEELERSRYAYRDELGRWTNDPVRRAQLDALADAVLRRERSCEAREYQR